MGLILVTNFGSLGGGKIIYIDAFGGVLLRGGGCLH